jgi:hypothetical protein
MRPPNLASAEGRLAECVSLRITVSMDSNTHGARYARLEVVDSGRRRRWSDEEKLKIVLESLAAPGQEPIGGLQ